MSTSVSNPGHGPVAWQATPARQFVDDERLRREWDGLNETAGHIPVLGSDVLAVALTALGGGREKLVVGRRGQAIVAMAILTPQSRMHWASFQPSQLPLGALVIAAGESVTDLGASLMRSPHMNGLLISFTQMDPLAISRGLDSANTRNDDYIQTAWIDVRGGFDAYWAERGKNLRQNMRKQRNRLASEGTSAVMRVWRDRDQMAPALSRYGEIESRGWKAAQGTAIEADNVQGKFYRALFESAASRGEALIYEYLFDSRTVAMNLCIHRGGTLVILKTTFDESVKPLSPAFLLQEEQLQMLFASGEFRRIEYYGRVMEWHTRWTDSSRTLFHTTVYRWPILRKLAEWRRRQSATSAAVTNTPEVDSATA